MKYRFFAGIILSVFLFSCDAEVDSSFEASAQLFSTAVPNDDVSKFKSAANPSGIYLVRKFTSGNLGGRGEELSANFSASSITEDMEFLVKDQTPFSLKLIFPSLPIKDDNKLPHYGMSEKICNLAFDQWDSLLKDVIAPLSESISGEPIVLTAASDCWVYAEAQVIDNMLVGGFAVFKKSAESVKLVSVINLL